MKHAKFIAALAVAVSFLGAPAYAQDPATPSGTKAPAAIALPNVAGIKRGTSINI